MGRDASMTHLTTAEAAVELGISPDGVRKLVKRGKLKPTRFGAALAYARNDIEKAKGRPKRGRPAR